MPSTIGVRLKATKAPRDVAFELTEEPLAARQKRLQHRTVLRPRIDLAGYSTRAVLDWVDIKFRLGRPTQWMWLQAEVEKAIGQKCFVSNWHQPGIRDGQEFITRIQESSLEMLLEAERAVRDRWTLQEPASVEEMEVSVDFRPTTPSEDALDLLFGVLVRCHLPNRDVMSVPRDRPRFAWGTGDGMNCFVLAAGDDHPERNDSLLVSVDHDAPVPIDATYYCGSDNAQSSWRIMTKLLDRQNRATGTTLVLPEDQRRVRIEVTLRRDEVEGLGIKSIADLTTFRWQTLQGSYFQFRLPTFADVSHLPASAIRSVKERREHQRRTKFLNAGVVGLKAMDEAQRRLNEHRRREVNKAASSDQRLPAAKRDGAGFYGTLIAYDELTRPVLWALRHLGKRMRVASKGVAK